MVYSTLWSQMKANSCSRLLLLHNYQTAIEITLNIAYVSFHLAQNWKHKSSWPKKAQNTVLW